MPCYKEKKGIEFNIIYELYEYSQKKSNCAQLHVFARNKKITQIFKPLLPKYYCFPIILENSVVVN